MHSVQVVKPGTMEMETEMEMEMEIQVCNGSSLVPRPPPAFIRIHEMGIRLGTRLQWQGLWTLDFTMGKKKKHSTLP